MAWVCAGAPVALILAWVVFVGAKYRRIFADNHLLEVAQGIARVKAAALDLVDDEFQPSAQPDSRAILTDAGLALIYTIQQENDQFIHHYSVSLAGRYTAHAVGETFVLLVAKVLGVPFQSLSLAIGKSTVHHAEFVLSRVEQIDFAARSVCKVSLTEIKGFQEERAEAAKTLHWDVLEIGPE